MKKIEPYEDVEGLRVFSQDTPDDELVWHRDREDRIIEVRGSTNWKIQLDNRFPMDLKKSQFIPKEVYHRLIKGDGDLVVKLIKL